MTVSCQCLIKNMISYNHMWITNLGQSPDNHLFKVFLAITLRKNVTPKKERTLLLVVLVLLHQLCTRIVIHKESLFSYLPTKTRLFFATDTPMWCWGVVVITTAEHHSTKSEIRFCACLNPAHGMLEVGDGKIFWQ